jgi:hypothetical protein
MNQKHTLAIAALFTCTGMTSAGYSAAQDNTVTTLRTKQTYARVEGNDTEGCTRGQIGIYAFENVRRETPVDTGGPEGPLLGVNYDGGNWCTGEHISMQASAPAALLQDIVIRSQLDHSDVTATFDSPAYKCVIVDEVESCGYKMVTIELDLHWTGNPDMFVRGRSSSTTRTGSTLVKSYQRGDIVLADLTYSIVIDGQEVVMAAYYPSLHYVREGRITFTQLTR